MSLPRHTGEGTGGGGPHRRSSKISDLKSARSSTEAFPLRPCRPPPPYDGGGRGCLTELSNVVAYACRPSSRKDRHDVHQHRRFESSGAVVVGRLHSARSRQSARPWPSNDRRKGRKPLSRRP